MSNPTEVPAAEFVPRAREIIDRAEKDLGTLTRGWRVNLLCDNMIDISTAQAQAIVALLSDTIEDEVEEAEPELKLSSNYIEAIVALENTALVAVEIIDPAFRLYTIRNVETGAIVQSHVAETDLTAYALAFIAGTDLVEESYYRDSMEEADRAMGDATP